jgi:dUTP pyrophosphatase
MNEQSQPVFFKKLDPRAVLPTRATPCSAGLDISCIEEVALGPRERLLVRTGLAVAIPDGYYGRLAPRSGLAAKKGLDILSGVIDSDYRGEIGCVLLNTGHEVIHLPAASRVCQLIIERIITPSAAWADDLSDTQRGEGGFGSSDRDSKSS